MPWTESDFPYSMTNLPLTIRLKAIEIANELVLQGFDEGRSIAIGISQAKDWSQNRGNETISKITHHLVPHEEGWAIKKQDAEIASYVFDTKDEALVKMKEIAKNHPVKIMIHDQKGQFQEVY